ncbi:ras association domain-containing protein 1-like isoform X4 [Lingula anatina]|uniref:Ras association domain-containing protein 1-like isoform X4 n=1 Tax=Lingula anatina TaxID=7574 RepID=A0A1S3JNE2_LINAN|nr:ras association domain-containing protein 1-like isoform X4 [Lingula anatina]|eukprot:XP_013411887.1 ras association domain-containing protein 1-like isoform X4 [Lingula anatina]
MAQNPQPKKRIIMRIRSQGSRELPPQPPGSPSGGSPKMGAKNLQQKFAKVNFGTKNPKLSDFEKCFNEFTDEFKHYHGSTDEESEEHKGKRPPLQRSDHDTDSKGQGHPEDQSFGEGEPCDCNYTCHHRCRPLVSIDCPHENTNNHRPRGNAETSLSEILQVTPGKVVRVRQQSDDVDSGYSTGSPHSSMYNSLTQEELRTKVETFNLSNPGLAMTMPDDSDTFQGFIRVNMNLTRPISMSLGTRPPSIYEVLTNEAQGDTLDRNTITSFYLPRDTVKALFVNSATTVRQVIDVLLRKFKITDNPRKFALYEQSYNDENKENPVKLRKLTDNEHPLMVCLDWPSARMEHRKFVLQENDMQEILWEEFSLPELQNFLKILDKEEQEYIQDIKYKFKVRKIHMQELLTEKNPNQEKGEKKGSKNKAE